MNLFRVAASIKTSSSPAARHVEIFVNLNVHRFRIAAHNRHAYHGGGNADFQYFCGEQELRVGNPCSYSELVEFRSRIGTSGAELILQESIRLNDDKKKALRADKKVKTIAGRLLRELERHLKDRKLYDIYAKRLELWNRVIIQRKEESIVRTEGGIILGRNRSGTTQVVIPDTPKATDRYYKRRKKHGLFCKRAGIAVFALNPAENFRRLLFCVWFIFLNFVQR